MSSVVPRALLHLLALILLVAGSPASAGALQDWDRIPVRLALRWNGAAVEIVHAPRAHTAGDAVVYLRGADVVHVGDLFFNGMYPFIDVNHGGALPGLAAACDDILARSGPSTPYVPGHGAIAEGARFQRYVEMLRTVHDRVSDRVGEVSVAPGVRTASGHAG